MHGKVWMFSHLIDDEDLAFLQREFVSYQQAMDYYGLGYKPKVKLFSEVVPSRFRKADVETYYAEHCSMLTNRKEENNYLDLRCE